MADYVNANKNNRKWRRLCIVLCIAVILLTGSNILLCVKYNIILNNSLFGHSGGGIYKYTDNTQYLAGVTMFDTYRLKKADIVFLGDSITARCDWSEVFTEYVTANRGIGSDTTEGLRNRLDSVVSLQPETVVILIGVNDISYGVEAGSPDHMRAIIDELREEIPDLEIIVVSVLPATSDTSTIDKIMDMNEIFRKICQEEMCTYLDMFEAFMEENGTLKRELYSDDLVHLNGRGYSVLFDGLEGLFRSLHL